MTTQERPAEGAQGTRKTEKPAAASKTYSMDLIKSLVGGSRVGSRLDAYCTTSRSLPARPKVSGWYISSALVGGTTKVPGVVARAT